MSPSRSSVLGAAIALPAIASTTVILRFYVRRCKSGIGKDDWMILGALALTWALGITLIVGVAMDCFGTTDLEGPQRGEDITDASFSAATNSIKLLWAFSLTMILALSVIKLSVLFFYRRIFVGKKFKIYWFTLCAIVALWCLVFFFAEIFQCSVHPDYWWTSKYTSHKLLFKTGDLELAFAGLDVILDLLILATPLPLIWNLKMSLSRKAGIMGVFLLGLLSTIGAITRLAIHMLIIYTTRMGPHDVLGNRVNITVWTLVTLVEAAVAIVAACLPILRPLVGDPSAESKVRSIRSMFSFNSNKLRSQRRHGSHDISLMKDCSGQEELEIDGSLSIEPKHVSDK